MVHIDGIFLKDYSQWAKANSPGNFSLYDYIHGITISKDISVDLYIAIIKLFWPDFITIEGNVFLKEQFQEEKHKELVESGFKGNDLEYWMNLINLDGFFKKASLKEIQYLGEFVACLWKKKLKADFPGKAFDAKCLTDAETDEIYIVFCQQKREEGDDVKP